MKVDARSQLLAAAPRGARGAALMAAALAVACSGEATPTPSSSPAATTATSTNTPSAAATWTLLGWAYDQDGQPLPGVEITAPGAAPVTTAADGSYQITGLAVEELELTPDPAPLDASPGARSISASPLLVTAALSGYTPTQKAVFAPAAGQEIAEDFHLAQLSQLSLSLLGTALRGATSSGLLVEVELASLEGAAGAPDPAQVSLQWAQATSASSINFAPEDGAAQASNQGLAYLKLVEGGAPLTLTGPMRVCLPSLTVRSEPLNVFALSEPGGSWAWQTSGRTDFLPSIPCVSFAVEVLGTIGLTPQVAATCACNSQLSVGMRVEDAEGNVGVVLCGAGDEDDRVKVSWGEGAAVDSSDTTLCACPSPLARAGLPTAGASWVACDELSDDPNGAFPCESLLTCWDHDSDGVTLDADCDDDDTFTLPGATESCDGKDEDCDGVVDEGATLEQWPDVDQDGFGDINSTPIPQCQGVSGYALTATDCDDAAAAVRPGGLEICDEVDNDCDGSVDEASTVTVYIDCDGDGFGLTSSGAEVCDSFSRPDPALWDGLCADPATAAFLVVGGDCDDQDPSLRPGAFELCDEVDQDCDGTVDEGALLTFGLDADGDGYGGDGGSALACEAPDGYAYGADDCDDALATVSPGAAEEADSVDQDCDGSIDEDTEVSDDDGDGACEADTGCLDDLPGGDCDDADPGASPTGAEQTLSGEDVCASFNADLASARVVSRPGPLFAVIWTATASSAVRRVEMLSAGATALASTGVWSVDADTGAPSAALEMSRPFALGEELDWRGRDLSAPVQLTQGETYYLVVEVEAGRYVLPVASSADETPATQGYCLGTREAGGDVSWGCTNYAPWQLRVVCDGCDSIDGDCDGLTDEGVERQAWPDLDADGFGDASGEPVSGCPIPDGYAPQAGDCDDSEASIHPAALEVVANSVDDDCDEAVDESANQGTPYPCASVHLGSALGDSVFSAPIGGSGDDTAPSETCTDGTGGLDVALTWIAPDNATYRFDTRTSTFDTVLYALSDCGGSELACNDDEDLGNAVLTSVIEISAERGDRLLLVIDAYSEFERGVATLNITQIAE